MAKSFSDQMGHIGYLEECAKYLESRGLDYRELSVVTNLTIDIGLHTRVNGEYFKCPIGGWAFRVKDKWGDEIEGAFLLRPQWPDAELYRKENGEWVLFEDRVKFRHVGDWTVNWVSTAAECKASPVVMIHEKFTCAYLSVKHLNVPSIGISGCYGWSREGAMHPDLRDVLSNLPASATVYMCLDGDVKTNEKIYLSAQRFLGYMEAMRPDVQVVFPMVPTGFTGWDDWAVAQDDVAGSWVKELNAQHVDVTSFLSLDVLINIYGLAYKTGKEGEISILHTTDNYAKLLAANPKWANYVLNIDDMMYDKDDPGTPLEYEDVARKVEVWLTQSVFRGAAAERVSGDKCLKAVKEVLARPERKFSLPHYHIDKMGGPVGEATARAAAERLVTEGIKVVGPMTHEETVETVLRMFRDMVGMWSYDWSWAPQWMCALVGPSNAGKSDFPRSVLRPLVEAGFIIANGKLHHTGDKAKPEEMARVLKTCLIGTVDEYNPADRSAKLYEDQLLSIAADRVISIRKMRENNPKPHLRNASVFITTTDKNRQYLRSGKGEGAERRAITFEIVPFWEYEGALSSNRAVVTECSRILLRWGLEAYRRGYPGSAVEFSKKYASQYLAEDDTLRNVAKSWTKNNISASLETYGAKLYRKATDDYRFSPTQLYELLYPNERITREQGQKIQNIALECGAEMIGKARVNPLYDGGKEVQVDKAMRVVGWQEWVDAMRSALGA